MDFVCRFHWALSRMKLDTTGHGKGVRWWLKEAAIR
jgi:hypothetical protein